MNYDLDELLKEDTLPSFDTRRNEFVPFPQANSLDCVLQVVIATEKSGSVLASYVVCNIVNNLRQAAYYINAAIYLGLCKRIGEVYYPTGDGLLLQKTSSEGRTACMAAIVLSHSVIGRWFTQVFRCNTTAEKLSLIQAGFKKPMAKATMMRRSQCVLSWLSWIQRHLPEL